MKKTLYLILPALLALCGCSEKIFPTRGVKKTTPTEQVTSADQPMQMVPVAQDAPAEEPAIEEDDALPISRGVDQD